MTKPTKFCPLINGTCRHGSRSSAEVPGSDKELICDPCPIKALRDLADDTIRRTENNKKFQDDLRNAMENAFAHVLNTMVAQPTVQGVGIPVQPSGEKVKVENWWPNQITCPKCSETMEIKEEPNTYLVPCSKCNYEIPISPNLK